MTTQTETPAEVWCSECDQPSVETIAGAALCATHALGMTQLIDDVVRDRLERDVIDAVFGARTLDDEAAELARDSKDAEELMRADPQLSIISALIIARDRSHAARAWELLRRGVRFRRALPFVGSYARLDFACRAIDAGYVELDVVLDQLPDLWSGSDPDDTDPRFLQLWLKAWRRNGRHYVRQQGGRALPRGARLTVYRGQDEGTPFGIAWSLDPKMAMKFATGAATRQHTRRGHTYRVDVPRAAILGYMTGRGESEVIVDPSSLREVPR